MEAPTTKKIDEDEPRKKGMALILHDLKQRELIPVKILKFLILASILFNYKSFILLNYITSLYTCLLFEGMGVLMPFMTIHMKSLGITVEETAIINGIVPPFSILSPSIMGMIADKLGNFKVSENNIIFSRLHNYIASTETGLFLCTYTPSSSFHLCKRNFYLFPINNRFC